MLHNKNFALFSAASLGASYTSPPLDLTIYYGAALQGVWTGGSASGTVSLAYSNNGNDWSLDSSSTQPVSGAGNFMWDLTTSQAAYVHLVFTRTSGTGSISGYVNAKTP